MKRAQVIRWLRSRRVGILKGGWSRERSISLKTAKAVEASFRRLKIPAQSIDFKPRSLFYLKKKKIQFCFICLHGTFGEDGSLQSLLEGMGISYTGSSPLASALAMNKDLAKRVFRKEGLPTADSVVISKESYRSKSKKDLYTIETLLKKGPVFVKPVSQGSAIGLSRVDKRSDVKEALRKCFVVSNNALVERFTKGRELTVGILGHRALPVIEIVPKHRFYDFHSKYAKGGSRHLVPAHLSKNQTKKAQRLALRAFQSLGCSAYGRVDFIVKPDGHFSLLEVNTIPGMTNVSLLPDAARAAGIDFNDLVLRIVALSVGSRTCEW